MPNVPDPTQRTARPADNRSYAQAAAAAPAAGTPATAPAAAASAPAGKAGQQQRGAAPAPAPAAAKSKPAHLADWQLPPFERDAAQDARTSALWHKHANAVELYNSAVRDEADAETVEFLKQKVVALRDELTLSKPPTDLLSGHLKKREQAQKMADKFIQQAEDAWVQASQANDKAVALSRKADEALAGVQRMDDQTPVLAAAAGAQPPAPKLQAAAVVLQAQLEVEKAAAARLQGGGDRAVADGLTADVAALVARLAEFTNSRQAAELREAQNLDPGGDATMGRSPALPATPVAQAAPAAEAPAGVVQAAQAAAAAETAPAAEPAQGTLPPAPAHGVPTVESPAAASGAGGLPVASAAEASVATSALPQGASEELLQTALLLGTPLQADSKAVASARTALRGQLACKDQEPAWLQRQVNKVQAVLAREPQLPLQPGAAAVTEDAAAGAPAGEKPGKRIKRAAEGPADRAADMVADDEDEDDIP